MNEPVQVSEMKLKDYYQSCISNDIMKGRIDLTNREAQLIYLAIAQVVKEDKDLKTYTVRAAELATFLGIEPDCLYDDLYDVCVKLKKRVIQKRESPQKWKVYGWIDTAEYDNGVLTIKLSDDLKPYLIDLNNYYVSCSIGNVKRFKSMYARRVFEWLLTDYRLHQEGIDQWSFSLTDIRDMFALHEKYEGGKRAGQYKRYNLTHDLLAKTFDVAVKELNTYDFIHITDYKHTKSGRAISGVSFNAEFFYDLDVKQDADKEQQRLKKMSEWKAKKIIDDRGDNQLTFDYLAKVEQAQAQA